MTKSGEPQVHNGTLGAAAASEKTTAGSIADARLNTDDADTDRFDTSDSDEDDAQSDSEQLDDEGSSLLSVSANVASTVAAADRSEGGLTGEATLSNASADLSSGMDGNLSVTSAAAPKMHSPFAANGLLELVSSYLGSDASEEEEKDASRKSDGGADDAFEDGEGTLGASDADAFMPPPVAAAALNFATHTSPQVCLSSQKCF